MGGFAATNEDILQNILFRLPASSFASAACVNKSWNKVCDTVLAYPKFATALSLNPSLPDAVKEVLDKVLSEPIRPQFAIASIGLQFSLEAAHQLITQKLDSKVSIVTSTACGIIGRDAITDKMKEVRWYMIPELEGSVSREFVEEFNRGILLIIGYLPGLKVDAIPLLRPKMGPRVTLVSKFLMDIKNYTASVSDTIAPEAMIMFGDQLVDLNHVLAEIDYAMPGDTVIAGDACSRFIYKSGHNSQAYNSDLYFFDAVALVFANDKNKPDDIGETQFHATMSTGVLSIGPELRAITVASKGSECSWLTMSLNGSDQILYSQRIFEDICGEKENEPGCFYIGVVKKRPSCIEQEKMELRTYLVFYEVIEANAEYLVVEGAGIQPGDTFQFYRSETALASETWRNSEGIDVLNPGSCYGYHYYRDSEGGVGNGGVFGGLLFSSQYCEETYFDSYPVYPNIPPTPLAGLFCAREIGRDFDTGPEEEEEEEEEESPARCSLHVCSSVFLLFYYEPPSPNL
ncbi:hypothetical protein V6N12_012963 [Hibiscus sabdariffa]|uniref:F-box domain-containing protein n=1 Tax=Hibiscus sabdariffa TaxID=183260 RepID=A0ABR2EHK1_9ROSI